MLLRLLQWEPTTPSCFFAASRAHMAALALPAFDKRKKLART
jgi:hypothetical protein